MNNEPRLSPFMRTIALIVALLVPLGTAPVSLQAATYYWDTNDTASGFGTAAGTWSTTTIGTTTMGWSTSSAGTDTVNGNSVTTANTNNTTDAINFGSGATGLSAGTITVTGTVAAGDMTFASGSGAIVLSGGTINLAATSTITVDNTSDTISSILAGAGTSLIKTGTGTLTLSGTNTFTGQLTVQNGTLSIATINNDSAVGTLGNSTSSVILGNTGAQTGTLQYTGGTASSTKKFTMATGGTGAFDVTGGATTLTLSGLIDGSGSLTKNGVGTLLLSNTANTYVGATTINGGILQVAALGGGSSNSSIGNPASTAASNLVINGGTLRYAGTTAQSTDRLFTIGTSGATLDASGTTNGAMSFTNTGSIAFSSVAPASLTLTGTGVTNATGTLASIIGDSGTGANITSLTKNGAGTWSLTATNTYTGATSINAGTLNLGGGTTTGSLASTVLNLGGGTFSYTRTGTNAQAFTTTNVTAGANAVTASLSTQTITLGSLAGRSVGATLDVGSTGTITTSTNNDATGIIGGWATLTSNNWAVSQNSGGPVDITGSAPYYTTTTGGTTAANYAAKNIDIDTSPTIVGNINANTIRFNSNTRTLTLAAGDNIFAAGGILVVSGVTGATISGGNLLGSSGGDLIVHGYGALTINSLIKDNGTATALTKTGSGTLTLSNNSNSYSGGTFINGGIISATSSTASGALGGAGKNVTFGGTGTLQHNVNSSTGFSLGTVTINAGATATINKTAAFNGGLTHTINNLTGSGTLVLDTDWPDTYNLGNASTFTGNIFIRNTSSAGSNNVTVNSLADAVGSNVQFSHNLGGGAGTTLTLELKNDSGPLTFNNRQIQILASPTGRTLTPTLTNNNNTAANKWVINTDLLNLDTGARTFALAGSNIGDNEFKGVIGNGSAGGTIGVTKSGNGKWILSGTNTYTGTTTITAGTLRVSTLANAGSNSSLGAFATPGATGISLGGGTLQYVGASGVSVDRGVTLTATSTIDVNPVSTSLTLGASSISGAFTLNVTGGTGSSLGLGALALTGAAVLNPTTANLTVASISSVAAQNLTLGGTSSDNTVTGAIATLTGILTKNTASTWTLSGSNSYTGATNVSVGLLRVNGSLNAGSAVGVSAGALGGTGTVGGAVTVSGTGGINLANGSLGTLTLSSTLSNTAVAAGGNNYYFDLGNSGTSPVNGTDKIAASAAFSMTTSGAVVVSPNQIGGSGNRLASGTYDIITAASGIVAANFQLATTKAFGQSFSLSSPATSALKLTATNVTAAAGNVTLSTASGSWAAGATFTPGNVPDYQSNVTINSATGTTPLNGSTDINSLIYGTNATSATIISAGTATSGTPASMLVIEAATVNGSTAPAGITLNNTSGTHTISANIGLASTQTWTMATGSGLTVSSSVSDFGGGYSLTKAGGGTLTLSGTNTFSGSLTIAGGTVRADGNALKGTNGLLGAGTTLVMGSNGQTGRLAIQVDGGVTVDKDITLATGGTGEIQFGNVGTFQNTNAARDLTLSGNISGSGNFTKLGGSAVGLTGNNTYSGTTTVNEGALRLGSATALPGGIGLTGGTSALTINGNNSSINIGATIQLTAASGDFLRGLGTGANQFQIPGGVSGFDANGSTRQVIVGNDATFELQWGIATFNPSALLLGFHSVTATGAITLQNKIDLNAATRTITVNTGAATATISGAIRTSSGTAGITKTGGGTLELSGSNTYNGPTTISAGTLTLSSVGAVGGTSQIVLGGTSTLHVNAVNVSLDKLATGGGVPLGTFLRYSQTQTAAGASNGPGTILGTVELNLTNVNPNYTLDFGGTISKLTNLVTATYNSPITLSSGSPSIDSSTAVFTGGTGMTIGASTAGDKTLFMTGSNTGANTLGGVIGNGSGTVAVTKTGAGAWALTGTNTYSGATTVSAGTLTLSGASGAITSSAVTIAGGTLTISNATAASNSDRLSGSLAFTMNGGTFNFNNDASANSFSEGAGTLTLIGGANTVAIQQAAVAQTSTLTFAGLSRTVGALSFSGTGLSTSVDPRSKITFTSAPSLTNGIIGYWATVNGTNYASLIGNDVVAYSGTLTDVNRGTGGTKAIADGATNDVRIIESGAAANITLGATTTTVRSILNSVSGGVAATATIAIGASETLRVDSINAVATTLAMNVGNVANTGTLTPATAGGNLLLINSSTNTMTVNSVIANFTSASSITKDGSGVVRLNGTNTYSGGTFVNAGTLLVPTNANLGDTTTAAGITFNGSAAVTFTDNTVTNETFNLGTRTITVNNGAIAALYLGNANKTLTTSGAITGTGGITLGRDPSMNSGGVGTVFNYNFLSDSNAFTGAFNVGSGTEGSAGGGLTITINSLADSTSAITMNYASAFNFNLGSTAANNLSVPSRPINLLNSNATIGNANALKTMTLGAVSTSTAGAKTLNLGAGGAGGIIAGNITNGNGTIAVTKSSSGTWALSGTNTYSGNTTISSDGGTIAILGKPALSPNTLISAGRGTTLSLRMDDAGTVILGNTIQPNTTDTSTGIANYVTIDARNNGGATTGSTLVLGKVDFATNLGSAATRGIQTTGANGYRVQFGDVDLSTAAQGTATGGGQRIEAVSAPITITGTIRQVSGNTGASTVDNNFFLGGSASGNLISGIIADALDYPSNPNATSLNITKGDAGTWTLSGSNTYTGTTTVSGGTLLINGNSSAANGAVSVTGGFLGGTGSLGGAVTLTSTGGLDLRDVSGVGTLTLGSTLAINGVAGANNLYFDLGNNTGTSDQISVAGTTTVNTTGAAVVNLNQLGGLAGRNATTYTLIGGAGTLDATNFGKFSLGTTAAFGQTYALANGGTNGDLQLVATNVTSATPAAFWSGGGTPTNNWSTTGNWRSTVAGGGAVAGAPDYQTNVTFTTTTPGPSQLTTNVLDVDFDINSLNFSNTSAVTIGGTKLLTIEATNANSNTAGRGINSTQTTVTNTIASKIGLAATQEWSVAGTTVALGGLTVSGVISDFGLGNGLNKTGTGTLTLSGANTFSGTVALKAGTLAIDTSNAALGTGTLQIGDSTGSTAVTLDSLTARSITNAVNIYQDFTYTRSANTLTQSTGAVTLLTNGTTGTKTITVGGALNTAGLTLGAVGDGGNNYGLTKAGNGTLNLASPFTYTGTTTINAGILALTSASNQSGGNIVINDGGTLFVTSGGGQTTGITISNNIVLGGSTGSRTLQTTGSNQRTTFTGAISVTASGPLTWNITHDNVPGYIPGGGSNTGGERGVISFYNAIPDGSNGALSLNISLNGQTNSGAYVNLVGQNTFTGNISVNYSKTGGVFAYLTIGGESYTTGGNNNSRAVANMGSGFLGGGNYTGTISLAGAQNTNIILNYLSSANQILGGAISGTGQQLLKEGTGTLILSGSNSYSGATTVSTGSLVARNATALGQGSTANVSVTAGANLSYFAATDTALNIGGTLTINGGTGTVIGGSVGGTATSAKINVAGNALVPTAPVTVNVYGVPGVSRPGTPGVTTTTYTLVSGLSGGATTLNSGTYTLGTVYNNTDFTVANITKSTTGLFIDVTKQTALNVGTFYVGGLSGASNVWAASNGSTRSNFSLTSGGTAQALVPGSAASVTVDSNSFATSTVLGADMSISGLTISDNTSNFALNADGYGLTIGTGGITKSNTTTKTATIAANLVLGGAQTWSNSDTGNALVVSGTITGANNLIVDGAGNTTISGRLLTGAGTLSKTGAGTLTLSGFNTYSGTTTISQGILNANSTNALGDSSSTNTLIFSGGTLQAGGAFTSTSTRGVSTIGTGGTIDTNGNAVTIAGIISGTGSITKSGTNTLTLNNTNTYTGSTTISQGTLNVNSTAALGAEANASNTLIFNGGTLQAGGAITSTSSRGVTLNSTGIIDTNGNAVSIAGIINGTGGLTKSGGTGTLTLTGSNTYTGTTTVTTGTLKLNGAGVNTTIVTDGNTATTSDILINGGTLELAASEQIANLGSINMSSGAFNFGAATGLTETIDKLTNSGGTFSTGANTLILLGNTVTWSGGTNTVNAGGSVQDQHIVISGGTNTVEGGNPAGGVLQLNGGGLGLEMSNGATLTLNSDAVSAGKLLLKGNVSTSGATTVTIANSGAATFLGNVDLDGGTRTFTIDNGAAADDMSISAVITNGSLIKAGAGTLVLTNTNTYSGNTAINGGVLKIYDLRNIGDDSQVTNTVSMDGGTLEVAASSTVVLGTNRDITLNAGGGTIQSDTSAALTVDGTISGAGSLTKTGPGSLTLSGTNTYTGSTTIAAGTLNANTTDALGDSSSTNTLIFSGGTLQAGGNITSTSSRGVSTVGTGGTVDTNGYAVSIAGIISGTGGLTKSGGTGTLTLTGTNTFTGPTLVSAGTLQIGNGGLTGSLSPSSSITTTAPGTLTFNRSNDVTQGTDFASVISGSGGVTQAGTGTLVFNGTNTYTGPTTVSAGTLQVGASSVGSTHASSTVTASSLSPASNTNGIGWNAANTPVTGQTVVTGAPVVSGTGNIFGPVVLGSNSSNLGVLRPGDSAGASNGQLSVGSLTVNNGSQLQFGLTSTLSNDTAWVSSTQSAKDYLDGLTIGGTDFTDATYVNLWKTADGDYDSIKSAGDMILGTGGSATYPTIWVGDAADLTFATNSLPSLVAGDIFKLLDWSTAFGSGGNFSGGAGNTFNLATDLVLPGLGAGLSWDTTAFKSYGVLGVSGVPEPGRMMLMFFGLAALFLRRRRNR